MKTLSIISILTLAFSFSGPVSFADHHEGDKKEIKCNCEGKKDCHCDHDCKDGKNCDSHKKAKKKHCEHCNHDKKEEAKK